ncbi:MAG: glycoside hydrolase family 28 protein [Atopobiaceae bacterium]|nr:glycoside hydrolase family 28 protein [Atopobiaceae bacterium]MCH4179840.1 glycoside hydrolase family 28 protein [Atopobiaceae bacterium]MCH4213591.1 glycoside hydrolase family 28 protein [Atopobiaceae bacterium]MCH4276239.1 glycoside hydrolase family 28 protein [Atopobiaceae bacterium]MCI1226040.1 glycoside hydrolase family 28 protein [Atopobiaceae bacterium]
MRLGITWKCARALVVRMDDGSTFSFDEPWDVYVNERPQGTTDRVLTYVDGLEPATYYRIRLERDGVSATTEVVTPAESFTLDVREFGAAGDGVRDDTGSIQAAILSCPDDGRVLVPAGTYSITSVFLASGVSLELAEGATLKARTDRTEFPILPGRIEGTGHKGFDGGDYLPLGTWEGESRKAFSGILCGMGVHDVRVYGRGTIDGNASDKDWWLDPKTIRVACRPRLVFLNRCERVDLAGITVRNSPSWTIHPYLSRHLGFWCLDIQGPKDSPNTDGLNPESCEDVSIMGCRFSVGDDDIAIKSGRLSMPAELRPPCRDITIEQCLMHDGHGAVVLGSEMAGGISGLTTRQCRFERTDRGLRVKTRRGRGKDAVVEGVVFDGIQMDEVKTPFVVNSFYFCDVDGKTDYVQSRDALPADERTPEVRSLCFQDVRATNCHAAAAWLTGLPERKISTLEFHRVRVSFSPEAIPAVPAMASGVDEMCRVGIVAQNVSRLVLDDVHVEGQEGDELLLQDVDEVERR